MMNNTHATSLTISCNAGIINVRNLGEWISWRILDWQVMVKAVPNDTLALAGAMVV
jgi:hypothetical protein